MTYEQEGQLEVQVGDETRVLNAGDSFYVPKGVPHRAYALTKVITVDVFTPVRTDLP
ncbi:cupin domain-containing protein [Sulfoacidibacillus ferrooxidans]|uniref:cupin domain-containing protein n=1 Tax=Sulfoacidibacillus ferrooxidans TaxID=2005001 RepID=UPI003AFB559A